MATYTVKIVDHTKSDELQKYKGGIKRLAQERFDEAFEDTSDHAYPVDTQAYHW